MYSPTSQYLCGRKEGKKERKSEFKVVSGWQDTRPLAEVGPNPTWFTQLGFGPTSTRPLAEVGPNPS